MNNYYYEIAKKYDGVTVAREYTEYRKWDFKVHVFSDGSSAIYCYEGNEINCIWGSTRTLKAHLTHLRNICDRDNKSIIPKHWEVVEPKFFEEMTIA